MQTLWRKRERDASFEVKIISDIIGSLIKKLVADCVNKLAQFQFRMTVLKGRSPSLILSSFLCLSLPPLLSLLSSLSIRYDIAYMGTCLMSLMWGANTEIQNLKTNLRDFVQKRNRLK